MKENETKDLTDRPGWSAIIEEALHAIELIEHSVEDRRTLRAVRVRRGRLHLEVAHPSEASRGVAAAARALSAEVCEMCGGRGNPVGDGQGQVGCRCEPCHAPGTVQLKRDWLRRGGKHQASVASPSNRFDDGGSPVAYEGGDRTGCIDADPSQTGMLKCLALLMTAEDDERAMRGWTANTGWAGLVRALVLALQSERRGGRSDAAESFQAMPYMKEKYGQLSLSFESYTKFVIGVDAFIEQMSARICMHCGMPGKLRERKWVRTECDACSAITDQRGRRF